MCCHGHHQKSMCSMPPRHAKQSSAKWLEARSNPLRSAQPKRFLKQNKNSSTWNKAHEYIMELSIFEYARNHQTYIFVQGRSRYEKQASATSKPNPLGSACNLKKKRPQPSLPKHRQPKVGRKCIGFFRVSSQSFHPPQKSPKKNNGFHHSPRHKKK